MQKMIKDKLKSVYELEKVTYEKIFKHGMDYSVVIYHTYTLVDGLYFISCITCWLNLSTPLIVTKQEMIFFFSWVSLAPCTNET